MPNRYDAIVIGAGNAGLSAATTLQRGGARTLLLERHNVPGGCATSFVRGRFEFEVALHQLSGVGSESKPFVMRDLFRGLGIADKIQLVEESEMYRTVRPGVFDVTLPADRTGVIDALDSAFPGCRDSVSRFLDLCRDVTMQKYGAMRMGADPAALASIRQDGAALLRYAFKSTQEVLEEFFPDKRLQFVLGSYWGYVGQPPSRLPFAEMAGLLHVYLEYKPFHIRGGSQTLSMAMLDSFYKAGGEARFNCGARKIQLRDGAVAGVVTEDGAQYACSAVVSNASSVTTYVDLLDPAQMPEPIRRDFRSRRVGVSGFVVYMGLDASPSELGLAASTSIISLDDDADRIFARMRTLEPALQVFASCYDVHPIGFSPPGCSHVTLITLQYADHWEHLDPARYAASKSHYAESLIDAFESIVPNVRDVIEEVDVATPLTMMRYLGHPGGAIYGFDQDAMDSWPLRSDRSHVPGLYLAGAWSTSGGFQPTLSAGARVARRILRNDREHADV